MSNDNSILSKYDVRIYKFASLNQDIKLPSFQRKLVWSNKQKQAFIKTLIDKYPFGSLLLYQYENGESFSLIDGLQRISTMRDFKENPTDYIEFDEYIEMLELMIPSNFSKQAKDKVRNYANELFKEIVQEYYKNPNIAYENLMFDNKVKDRLLDEFAFLEENNLISNPFKEDGENITIGIALKHIQKLVIRSFEEKLNIDDVEIPCIIFKGKEEELAEVFQRLNTGGQKLSKYQVFAAAWDSYNISLGEYSNSIELISRVIDRYNNYIEDHEIEIEGFDETEIRESREVNLSEFCYGLGSLIVEELPVFFSKGNEDLYNELGYQTLSIVFKVPTNEMSILVKYIEFLRQEPKQLESLIEKINEVYSAINKCFSERFCLPSHRKNKYETKPFTRLQILSFFASLWNIEYDFDPEKLDPKDGLLIKNNTRRKKQRQIFKDNIIQYAIYDSLRKYWSASGDRKLIHIYVNDENRYLEKVDKSAFENELGMWNKDMTSKANIRINNEVKMLLTYLASFNIHDYQNISENFDFEHIIPQKDLKDIYKKYIISGGSIGNIMLLDENTNRKLKDKYLYDIESNDDLIRDIKAYYELSSYPTRDTIERLKNVNNKSTPSSYQDMIRSRGNEIITRIVEESYDN